jgi:DNA-binding transcriptional LysR family regulator
MTIDNLKCFILVAENLSFARAAESLYISQPAVTKQINSLEAELETTLFIRSTRHVELTPAGMSFYKDAKEIVTKTQLAVQRLQSQNTEIGTLRIGVSNSAMLS